MNERPAEDLLKAAEAARAEAYAPFSDYLVGAAVEDEQGRVHSGCNVENASFGASMCAERVAMFKMVSEGGRRVARLAVATQDGGVPCGMCLQVLREFAPDPNTVEIWCASLDGDARRFTLHELLPVEFDFNERKG